MKNLENITVRPATNDDCENVQDLVFGILREYDLEPDLQGTDLDLTDIEANYAGRGGVFEVFEDERGRLLGTVGLFPLTGDTVELRKMYFCKDLRGQGFGAKTLERMIEKARELGFKRIYLETATVLREAVGLYEKFGFQPTNEKHTPRCDAAYTRNI